MTNCAVQYNDMLWNAMFTGNLIEAREAIICGARIDLTSKKHNLIDVAYLGRNIDLFQLVLAAGLAMTKGKKERQLCVFDRILAKQDVQFLCALRNFHRDPIQIDHPHILWLNMSTIQFAVAQNVSFGSRFFSRLVWWHKKIDIEKVFRFLIACDILTNRVRDKVMSVLMQSLTEKNNVSSHGNVLDLLFESGMQQDREIVLWCVQCGELLRLRRMLFYKNDIKAQTLRYLIGRAINSRQNHIVDYLLRRFAVVPSAKMLKTAACCGNVAVIPVLAQNGADLNHYLDIAGKDKNEQLVEKLLLSGATINVFRSGNRWTKAANDFVVQTYIRLQKQWLCFGLAHLQLPVLISVHIYDACLNREMRDRETMFRKWKIFMLVKRAADTLKT